MGKFLNNLERFD